MRYKIISRTSRLLSYIANGNKLMAFQKEAAFCDKRITRNTSKKKKLYPIKRKNWGGRIALNITQLRKLKWCLSSNFGAPIANVRRFIRRKLIVSLYFINHCFGLFKIIQTKPYNIETNCKPRDRSGPAQLSFFKQPRQQLEEKPDSSSVQSAVNLEICLETKTLHKQIVWLVLLV